MRGIYTECLSGAGLSDALRTKLYVEAVMLIRDVGVEIRRFTFGVVAVGWVRTSRATGCLGGLTGVRCAAVIEHDGGKTEISYLVNDPGPDFSYASLGEFVRLEGGVSDATIAREMSRLHTEEFSPGMRDPDAS